MNTQIQTRSQTTKRTGSDMLVDLIISEGYQLFRDQYGEACISSPSEPLIAKRILSKETLLMLRRIVWEKYKKSAHPSSIECSQLTLEGLAIFSDVVKETHTRIAKVGNTIYYDIGDNKHVVIITADGWKVETSAPVYFRRYTHQLPQVLPITGGDISEIKKYIHIGTTIHEILLVSYLPVCFVADIDRPLLLMHGPQGAGKSTALEFVRALIDPSRLPLLQPPRDVIEMVQQANKHYAYFLDNVSFIKQDVSDTFCRFVTGSAFSKRVLYTDDDDFLYEFKRVTGFTSIAQVANNSDLLDRSLIIQLEIIDKAARLSDEQLSSKFSEEKPKLLGSLFDAVSGMLRNIKDIHFDELPRMADYYRYAAAASQHLKYGVAEYVDAYTTNVKHQNRESIESSPVIQCILIFMKGKNTYTGTSMALYLLLKDIAMNFDMIVGFPKGATWLWRKIQQNKATLVSIGINADRDRNSESRFISINKTETYNTAMDESIPDLHEADQTVFTDVLGDLPR
jgi:hypothetical protein